MQWILWRVCRLSADTAAKLSAVVGDEVGWLQQQIRVWLPAFWRQCWHSIQRYDSHATTHRRQVRSLIQLLQHATSDSVSLLYETYPGCSTPLINHKLMILYYLHRAQISVLWDNRGYTMRKWDVSKFCKHFFSLQTDSSHFSDKTYLSVALRLLGWWWPRTWTSWKVRNLKSVREIMTSPGYCGLCVGALAVAIVRK